MTDDVLIELNKKHVNKTFNKLTILEIQKEIILTRQQPVEYVAFCLCECGKTTYINFHNVQSGRTKSCGCLSRTQDGASYERIYYLWSYKKHSTVQGVSLEWEEFDTFKEWCETNDFKDDETLKPLDPKKPLGPNNVVVIKKRISKKSLKKAYLFVSPEGEDHIVFDFLDFCYEKGLNPYMSVRAMKGYQNFIQSGKKEYSTHSGWTIKKLKEEDFTKPTYEDRLYYPYTDLF